MNQTTEQTVRTGLERLSRATGRLALFATALVIAAAAALAPEVAVAADRALERGEDSGLILWATVLATGALFLIAGLGYLYRRERGLDWEFQKPDAPHDEHH